MYFLTDTIKNYTYVSTWQQCSPWIFGWDSICVHLKRVQSWYSAKHGDTSVFSVAFCFSKLVPIRGDSPALIGSNCFERMRNFILKNLPRFYQSAVWELISCNGSSLCDSRLQDMRPSDVKRTALRDYFLFRSNRFLPDWTL